MQKRFEIISIQMVIRVENHDRIPHDTNVTIYLHPDTVDMFNENRIAYSEIIKKIESVHGDDWSVEDGPTG